MSAPPSKTISKDLKNLLSFRLSLRSLLWSSALLLLLLFSYVAFTQAPHPDVFRQVKFFSGDWWRYPVERNAFKRLPVLNSALHEVFVLPGTDKAWVVGERGTILHTSDGGQSWQPQTSGTETSLISVSMNGDGLRGWVVGDEGTILHTRDGGTSWQAQMSRTPSRFNSVSMNIDGRRGWVAGEYGTILRTSDGGASWQEQTSGTDVTLGSVSMNGDGLRGWVVGDEGTILHTSDGGQSWQPQTSGTDAALISISMNGDGLRGWVVGLSGTILHTRDGGQSWQPQTSGTVSNLYSVRMTPDGLRGWLVGHNGTILHTSDGGQNWQPQTSGTVSNLYSISMNGDGLRGWVVGDEGTILHTSDGGQSWQPQTSGTDAALISISMNGDGLRGWVVGLSGTILHTSDGGQSWQAQASGIDNELNSVSMTPDGRRVWVVGSNGTILHTSDGGETWQPQTSGTGEWFRSVSMTADGRRVWVGGSNGTILHTSDGGQNWQPQTSGTANYLLSVSMTPDGLRGWGVGDNGTILHTSDGGQSWQSQTSVTGNPLFSVSMNGDGQRGWVVGYGGTILHTKDGGQSWQVQTSETYTTLISVSMNGDGQRGWVVGYGGTILHTIDGGQSWQPQTSGTVSNLYSVRMTPDGRRVWVVGSNGTILQTSDGGQNWIDIVKYRRYPAPWYYLSWLPILLLALVALRLRTREEVEEIESVADVLVSDRPLEKGDPDPLQFSAVSSGLSRYLRNENTEPPLTIAITGEWGSGKSSLMNLLKSDLESYGFQPVWFNAWHYQKEEHLLASLLENIQSQAIPSILSWAGISFRVKLLIKRGQRNLFKSGVILILAAITLGFLYQDEGTLLERFDHLAGLFKELFSDTQVGNTTSVSEIGIADTLGKLFEVGNFSIYSLFTLIPALMIALLNGASAFGLNPAKLLSSMSGKFTAKEMKGQLSFRYTFQKEFAEVAEALNPRTMVILVDDLDRCRPENVLEVLESINFLVSSGPCYVVLGMDPKRVVRCVGLEFKDLAAESIGEWGVVNQATSEEDGGKEWRAAFARRYLEKLINIEVPVPQADADESRALLAAEKQSVNFEDRDVGFRTLRSLLRSAFLFLNSHGKKVLTTTLAALLIFAGFQWGVEMANQDRNKSFGPAVTKTSPSTTTTAVQSEARSVESQAESETEAGREEEITIFKPGQKSPLLFEIIFLPLALLLGVLIVIIIRQPEVVVRDSPQFGASLKLWHKLVVFYNNTPRSLKRFLNKVRYFAMRQGNVDEFTENRYLKRLNEWLGISKESVTSELTLPEHVLVALSAIHHAEPNWLEDLYAINNESEKDKKTDETHQELQSKEVFAEIVKQYVEDFEAWPPTEKQIEIFKKMSEGISVH